MEKIPQTVPTNRQQGKIGQTQATYNVKPPAFGINRKNYVNFNIKSKGHLKNLKTNSGPYLGLDLSIHAKKRPEISRETLRLNAALGKLH